jgi:hypothetical protein
VTHADASQRNTAVVLPVLASKNHTVKVILLLVWVSTSPLVWLLALPAHPWQ